MALCICAGLTGNTGVINVFASEEDPDTVRIGALKGPTAMGMAQLLDADGYDFTVAASPDEIVPMVVQDKLDIAAVPANLAATLYQKTNKDVSVLAVNTLGVLYLVENGDSVKSVEDLKGKTIYASGKGATPEYALNSVLKANGIDPEKDVTVEYKSEHAEVVSALVQDQTAAGICKRRGGCAIIKWKFTARGEQPCCICTGATARARLPPPWGWRCGRWAMAAGWSFCNF